MPLWMQPPALAVVALLLATGFATPAEAKLRICNKSEIAALVAVGRFDGKGWLSDVVWLVPEKSCADIIQGPLTSRFYYLRGVQVGIDGAWDSNRYFFCVARDNFTIKGRKQCK